MKEEANIAMGLLTANKWQPSVLQLLPFSNNNVGVKRDVQGVPSATFSEGGPDREFPMLAVTRSENARPRSKSANVSSEASSAQAGGVERKLGEGQQHRLFRASSERLARGAERTSASNGPSATASSKHKTKLRARSDYGISTFYKKPEVVKISVNDINEQILGKNRVRSAVTIDEGATSKIYDSPNNPFRTRLRDEREDGEEWRGNVREEDKGVKAKFPKSALKPNQGRWPNSGMTFWSSASTASNMANIRATPRANQRTRGSEIYAAGSRETNTAPAEVYFRRDGRRVKLNVNELPRSKTPIADNDPDKLNMQHVIAFLQSSSNGDECGVMTEAEDPRTIVARVKSGQLAHQPIKRSAINGVITASPDQNGLVSIRPSHTGTKTGNASPGNTMQFLPGDDLEITPHRLSFNKTIAHLEELKDRVISDTSHISSKPGTESMELYRKTRTTPNNNGGILQYSDFKTHSVSLSEKANLSSTGYPNLEDVHIPLSIRKIRDSRHGGDTKPFRLHRFLTLVSNGSESILNAPEKIERSAGGAGQSKNISKRRSLRKGSGNDKPDKRRTVQRQYHPDSNLYYLDVGTPYNDRPRSKRGSAGSSNTRQDDAEAEMLKKDLHRVIRLPRAHYEADSDEEGSPYCTMPAPRNRRALTLSAQGRAIKDIISENNNKLSAAQQQADSQLSKKTGNLKDTATNDEDVSTSLSKKEPGTQNASDRFEDTETIPSEPSAGKQKDSHPIPLGEARDRVLNSELPLARSSEMSPDKMSTVTFQDMLHLRSDPGLGASKKDTFSTNVDPGSTTFLTQASPSSSPSQAEQHRLSPINTRQQKKSATGGSPLSKREGGASSSITNGSSPSPTRDHVKLSLRKEKNKTRELTYMFQVDNDGVESFSPSPK